MNNLLNQIQTDLAEIHKALDAGKLDAAREQVHYLHAFIQSQKASEQQLLPEIELTAV